MRNREIRVISNGPAYSADVLSNFTKVMETEVSRLVNADELEAADYLEKTWDWFATLYWRRYESSTWGRGGCST